MNRKNGRKHGEVFTNNLTVAYILDQVGYCSELDLRNVTILEPAAGKGDFAVEILRRLFKSSVQFGFSFHKALKNIRLVEQDIMVYNALVQNINREVSSLTGAEYTAGARFCVHGDFLSFNFTSLFDCIAGNPPYIRHERIPEADKLKYRKVFDTFKYRADIYIPFFEKGLSLLKQGGLLSYICSNRWLNNQYGEGLRSLIATKYRLVKLVNMEQTSPFDEQVIAYPCITVIENSKPLPHTLLYDTHSKTIDFTDLYFSKIPMPVNDDWHNLFIHYNLDNHYLTGILDQGYHIGIGVATGADQVFIKSADELTQIEQSRLIPLIKASDIKNDGILWGGHRLINPYDDNGLCDLNQFPGMGNYLMGHKDKLLNRHTTKKNRDKWYKTIDKIKPELRFKPKLLIPDFAGSNWLFVDEGKFYPHHNLYYITAPDIAQLKILGAILMSDFIREQLFVSGVRMNDGLPRLQAQLLKKIRIPKIEILSSSDRSTLIAAYEQRNKVLIDRVVRSYCVQWGINTGENPVRQAG